MVALGPLQLVVIGLLERASASSIADIVRRINEPENVRLIDAIVATKSGEGGISVSDDLAGNVRETERIDGMLRLSLFGGEFEEHSAILSNVSSGFLSNQFGDFGLVEAQVLEIADLIPRNSSALFLLIEHRWELRFKEEVVDFGGSVLANGLISPATLVALRKKSAKLLD